MKFYSIISVAAVGTHVATHLIFWRDLMTLSYLVVLLLTVLIYGGCIQAMRYMGKSFIHGDWGNFETGGIDLNMVARPCRAFERFDHLDCIYSNTLTHIRLCMAPLAFGTRSCSLLTLGQHPGPMVLPAGSP
uniref:Uncharacterized protein n=1 Tax=Ixodes ricinus TaxID=34613 RepID=V5GJY6_IXORI